MVFTISNNSNNSLDISNANSSDGSKPKVWKQFVLAFLASLPFFTHGVETTALSVSAHAGHFIITEGDVPWSTTALIIAAIVSAPLYCFVVDRYGRRSGVYMVNLIQGASCVPLFLPETEISIIVLHVFAGISFGGLFTVMPTYIREISNDKNRGVTVSITLLLTTAGYLMYLVIDLESMMFLMVALVAAQFIAMLVMVESPSYLVMVGKNGAARSTLAKLTCLSEEDQTVTKELHVLKDESDRAKANGKLSLWRILKNPIYRDIIKIGIVLNTVTVLCGSIVFLDQEKTLIQLKMPVDAEKTLVVVCLACGSLFTLLLSWFLDRKYLLSLGYTFMVLSIGVLAVYTQTDLTVTSLRLIPVVSLGIVVFSYGVVWGLPFVVVVEMLNLQVRSKAVSLIFVYSQLLKLAHLHTFKYVEEYMGIYTVLYVFSIINMFGAVYTIFLIPYIKDKTVKQIERQLKREPILKFNCKPIKI